MPESSSLHRPTADERREAILDAALELFADRGFHGTPVPLVAERAKVGAGTLYRYFDSKEALVNALYQREKRKLLSEILDGFPFDGPPRAQVAAFVRRTVGWARTSPDSMRFLELHHHATYLDEASLALEAESLRYIEGFFLAAQAASAVKAISPAVLGAVVWGMMIGVFKAVRSGHLTLDDSTLAEVERCCWEAIRA